MPLPELLNQPTPDADSHVVFICRGGRRSIRAAFAVQERGHPTSLCSRAECSHGKPPAFLKKGLSLDDVLTCRDLVDSKMVFFVATAITDGPLLSGVHIESNHSKTETILLRGETSTKRIIRAEHGTPDVESSEK